MRIHLSWFSAFIGIQLCCTAASNAQTAPAKKTANPVATSVMALQPQPTTAAHGKLDLRPPKITDVLSEVAIARALSTTRDPETIEEIEVEGSRNKAAPLTPVVPGGILAPFWAVLHPTQAWRILAPLPPDQAEALAGPPPSATDPYRPPVLPPR